MTVTQELHVIFGTGQAGAATARALAKAGRRIRVVNRSGQPNPWLPAGIEVRSADAADPASAVAAAQGASVIYQCLNAPYNRWPEVFPGLQAGVLQAAGDLGARLVVLENVYMYGLVDGPITEDLPYRAQTRKGRVRAHMSRELIDAHERGKVQVAIGRASDYYGPGVTASALGERTFRPLVTGRPAEIAGNADVPHSYAYIDDVGTGLATLGMHDRAFGEIWHLPHAPAVSPRKMLDFAFEHLGLRPQIRTVGRTMLSIAGLFIPEARETVEMLYEFEEPFIVDNKKFSAAFGERVTPLREGMLCTVDWYRDQQNRQ